ncbi:Cof-type HAD-IIB family hydrolase [Mycoplasmopsis pullorum]|uniref:HAD family hydrolase n=1 Tax=Mycoplasmopsis pullorum TaxID=48003 RepID=UPI00111B3B9F|nr:HAD family hydrolase [Mycoplasmopsis pullorum]TNK82459.1 Cof-type HAD-IIB family hydrolase [Mycoplasmopsis pullorum]TNK83061.1 Cof-type HAD-IIB family hydrolase [Mycoplasmopsis pullorum]TNK84598.1 Cof-type HAD-IIB family hydrolase [Mycoplasmopsis pullorum]TNK85516.1 Cof-type HAD-IIB family hydrolase [Mycoplasmopsis pullorum]TNK85898.1 Cof-type HAD-IIB family hydrolase [Mycoplasmopsis pullorum]
MSYNKVFAFDLDGTLLKKDNTVNEFTAKVIKQAHESNNLNIVATGRGILKVLPLIENGTLDGFDYLVCSNGALVYDLNKKSKIVLGAVDLESYKIMREAVIKHDLIFTVDTDSFNGSFVSGDKDYPDWVKPEERMDLAYLNRRTLKQLDEVAYASDTKLIQLALRCPIEKAESIYNEIKAKINGRQSVFLTNAIYVDVNSKGISKFAGLEYVLKLTNTNESQLYTFGDSGNDVEMIKGAFKGYAMANATQVAKNAADEVIGANDTDAIGQKMLEILNS